MPWRLVFWDFSMTFMDPSPGKKFIWVHAVVPNPECKFKQVHILDQYLHLVLEIIRTLFTPTISIRQDCE